MAKTAFLFAGQGAQTPGMASDTLACARAAALIEESRVLLPGIADVMLQGTSEQLADTRVTQPAMFLADLCYAYAREEQVGIPDAVCGFSVGEVPALVYAGALSPADGMRVIAERARLMGEACDKNGGVMVAVLGVKSEDVEALAHRAGAWAVNYNSPVQTVVACPAHREADLNEQLAAAKARGIKLKVSGAFHCPLMAEASQKFEEFLRGVCFLQPKIPVYANLTAKPYEGDFAAVLAAQMRSPVLFCRTVQNLNEQGFTRYEEVGPGKVLTGLVAKIGR